MNHTVYRVVKGPYKGTIGTFSRVIADKNKVLLSIINPGNHIEYQVDPKDTEIISDYDTTPLA